tara:strand:+ start:8654 stop:12388 length:3735 start_codon:yes stop_codon:yes gene_type:complete
LRANPQQRLILIKELSKKSKSYFSIPLSCVFRSNLDLDLLEKSLKFIFERHDIFKVKIDTNQYDFKLGSVDSNAVVTLSFQNKDQYQSFIEEDMEKGFDLRSDGLYRFFLIDLPEQTIVYFNIHHVIWDGTSSTQFLIELKKVYEALKQDLEPKLPILSPSRYENYQKKLESFKSFKESEVDHFYEGQTKLNLSSDFPANSDFSNLSNMSHFKMSSDKFEDLQQFCEGSKFSLFDFLHACFSVLLYRYSGNREFNIASPVLGRYSREDLLSLGFYVRTSIYPCRLNTGESFLRLLESYQENSMKARELAKLPLDGVGFQAFFMYQDFRSRVFEIDKVSMKRIHHNNGISQSQLDLWISVDGDGIEGGFQYPKTFFKPSTIELMQKEYLSIIDHLISQPESEYCDLGTNSYQDELNNVFFQRDENFLQKDFLDQLRENCEKFPDKIAVYDQASKGLSYRELEQRSDQFAQFLQGKGLNRGDIVGVALERKKELLIVLLGIWKSGCAYLPLDTSFPQQRLDFIIQDSGLNFIIEDLDEFEVYSKESDFSKVGDFKLINPNPEDLAYIIYTSGTTGNPKGVKIGFSQLNNFLESMHLTPGMDQKDRLLAVTTISFDISILELFLPLKVGASLYICSTEEAKNPQKLSSLIDENNITLMQATPVTWRLLLNFGWKGKENLKILCGGEKLPREIIESLLTKSESLWNMYGPTETTVWSTCKRISDPKELITVGKPILGTKIRIADYNLNEKVLGAVGEILISGAGLSEGYLNREKLTTEKFIQFDGERFYRTGDQGRVSSWGDLICLGRLDHQVKVRGFRIELGDIEFQLSSLDGVNQAVVTVREDIQGDKKLVAYIQSENPQLNEQWIRDSIGLKLPKYMIPDILMLIEKIPMTLNGKVDTKSLPNPMDERVKLEEISTKPTTKFEKTIARIWQEELKLPQVYLEDNFFMIGGNSLAAASVFQKIAKEFELNLELSMLYEYPNLTLLAAEIEALKKGKQRDFKNIIAMNSVKDKKKIFFFHAIGGNTLNYRIFAEELTDFEVYGVNSTGVDGYNLRSYSIEAMAENYLRQILEISKRGPYFLVGGSLGGLIAFEVARLMRMRGLEVASLIMFDTSVPQRKRSKVDAESRQEEKSFRTFGWDQLRRRFLALVNIIYRFFDKPMPMHLRVALLEFYNFLALKRYRPGSYLGEMYLIRIPKKEAGIYSKEFLGWEDYIKGEIQVDYVDAPHDHFIESRDVAKIFKDYLNRF